MSLQALATCPPVTPCSVEQNGRLCTFRLAQVNMLDAVAHTVCLMYVLRPMRESLRFANIQEFCHSQ